MPERRQMHLVVGGLALIVSAALSWGRYWTEGEHGPTVLLVALIFGIVAASLVMVLLSSNVGSGTDLRNLGNAGPIWLVLLLVAVIISEGVDHSLLGHPAARLAFATVAGACLGAALGVRLDFGRQESVNRDGSSPREERSPRPRRSSPGSPPRDTWWPRR